MENCVSTENSVMSMFFEMTPNYVSTLNLNEDIFISTG